MAVSRFNSSISSFGESPLNKKKLQCSKKYERRKVQKIHESISRTLLHELRPQGTKEVEGNYYVVER